MKKYITAGITVFMLSACNTILEENNIYKFSVRDGKQDSIQLKDYKGKVLLVVNTASHCGFTPQYDGLEKLYKDYHEKGVEILDFPCNQFGEQAPECDSAYAAFCQLNFKTEFQQLHKIEVNGKNEHPLYTWLKAQNVTDRSINTEIKWNFTKFLIDQEGKVVKRYESEVKIEDITPDIEKLLDKK